MATKPFPVPSPKNVPWDKGHMDDKTFIEKHLGLQYPPDRILKAGIELLKGERSNLDGIYDTKQKKGSHVLDEESKVGILKRIVGSVFPGWSTSIDEETQTVTFTEDSTDLADPPKPALKVGAPVSFTQGGKSYTGTVLSINHGDNTAKIKVEGSEWSPDIPLGALKLLGTPSVKADAPAETVSLAYQAPVVLSPVEKIGKNRFKKAILPVGKSIHYQRDGVKKVLSFSKEYLGQMLSNLKVKAFDQVPLLAHHPNDSVVNPEHYHGHLVDGELDDEYLYGIFETTDRGAKALEENPNLPTSPGYLENYTRRADNKHFGPTLQHIAFTYTPAVPGLKGWESLVQMEEDEAKVVVVDLTAQSWENPNGEPAGGPEGEEGHTLDENTGTAQVPNNEEEVNEVKPEVNPEENAEATVTLAEFNALKERMDAERTERERNGQVLRRQGIRKMLSEDYGQKGVPKAKIDAAFALLDGHDGLVTLSEVGDASFNEDDKASAIKELLEGYKGTIEFGENGTQEEPQDLDEETRLDKRSRVLMVEKDITYEKAFDLALLEEVK